MMRSKSFLIKFMLLQLTIFYFASCGKNKNENLMDKEISIEYSVQTKDREKHNLEATFIFTCQKKVNKKIFVDVSPISNRIILPKIAANDKCNIKIKNFTYNNNKYIQISNNTINYSSLNNQHLFTGELKLKSNNKNYSFSILHTDKINFLLKGLEISEISNLEGYTLKKINDLEAILYFYFAKKSSLKVTKDNQNFFLSDQKNIPLSVSAKETSPYCSPKTAQNDCYIYIKHNNEKINDSLLLNLEVKHRNKIEKNQVMVYKDVEEYFMVDDENRFCNGLLKKTNNQFNCLYINNDKNPNILSKSSITKIAIDSNNHLFLRVDDEYYKLFEDTNEFKTLAEFSKTDLSWYMFKKNTEGITNQIFTTNKHIVLNKWSMTNLIKPKKYSLNILTHNIKDILGKDQRIILTSENAKNIIIQNAFLIDNPENNYFSAKISSNDESPIYLQTFVQCARYTIPSNSNFACNFFTDQLQNRYFKLNFIFNFSDNTKILRELRLNQKELNKSLKINIYTYFEKQLIIVGQLSFPIKIMYKNEEYTVQEIEENDIFFKKCLPQAVKLTHNLIDNNYFNFIEQPTCVEVH